MAGRGQRPLKTSNFQVDEKKINKEALGRFGSAGQRQVEMAEYHSGVCPR